jgi:hypothetical protein
VEKLSTAHEKINNIKGDKTGILDPFDVKDDWFFLEIPSCLIKANLMLDKALRSMINVAIDSLTLNSDDRFVQERCDTLIDYAKGEMSMEFLGKRYPFLAKEVRRQGLDQANLWELFKV